MKNFLIGSSIFIVVVLFALRIVFIKSGGAKEEREWFVRNLKYEFSSEVDSVIMLRGDVGPGRLVCHLTGGNPDSTREDSLNHHLKDHKSLQFISHRNGRLLEFIILGAQNFIAGDSVHVSSENNSIRFFRNRKELSADPLSIMLEARGNMFVF